MTVVVTRQPALPPLAPSRSPLELAGDASGRAAFAWHPERSPWGPISIVISLADGRMIVLRNGIEIGASTFSLDGAVAGTEAYILGSVDSSGRHWLRLPLPGQDDQVRPVPGTGRRRFSAPEEFRAFVAPLLVPGTTVLLTNDSLGRGDRESRLELLASEPISK
jgi:hypothetical protein